MRFCHSFRSGIPLFRAGHLRVTHPFATNVLLHPSDLHVLGTPPAFILSQDQTLRYFSSYLLSKICYLFALRNQSGLFLHFCCFSIVKVLRAPLFPRRNVLLYVFSPLCQGLFSIPKKLITPDFSACSPKSLDRILC